MVAIEKELPLLQLDVRDAAAGLELSRGAKWNQNEADWRFFLAKGTVYGMRDSASELIATAALLPYTKREAWISMVLVTESWRRRGLATRLVDACLDSAMRLGLTTWLDATPAGAAVYGPLGFAPTIQLRRLRLERGTSAGPGNELAPGKLGDFITCDIDAMGFDRRDLISELCGRPGSRLLSTNEATALVRDGRTARQIGPVFAASPESALALVAEIVAGEPGAHLIDAVADHATFLDGLMRAGWTIERPFQRMRFGRTAVQPGEPPFAVAGPEFG
ncbi:GNAT family N-acetyltransferase [Bradyrhizobium sp. Tv2a-2]|uniref:GNAT family N-acetyltransferase n=1 Tax=Bradyrhizobium sp. Tv2a-2 TaxID=113395 RepID=UPI0003F795C0|nr:GNAT family N-acetyltransferase [Bradyrhizobium sp. Tv2a-2]